MDQGHEAAPSAHDDLDDPEARPPRMVTNDQAVIYHIRRILEQEQVPLEQRQVLARAFYEDWVLGEADAWERWLERCQGRAH